MNGELGHMSPQTTVRLELYFFRKKEYCVSIEILKSKSLQAMHLRVISILELSLVTELITWLLFILVLRLNVYLLYSLQMSVFLSIADISEVFASMFKFLFHLLVQTSRFLFYIPAIR